MTAFERAGLRVRQGGAIVAHGPRSHCFHVGSFKNHTFKDFERKVDMRKVDMMTLPGSNGGIFIKVNDRCQHGLL
jgi:hypothetical protein